MSQQNNIYFQHPIAAVMTRKYSLVKPGLLHKKVKKSGIKQQN